MKNPLFKPADAPITPEEEAEITRRLAEAYQRQEAALKSPELLRLLGRLSEKLTESTRPPSQESHAPPTELSP
jgi:hypothetical protein